MTQLKALNITYTVRGRDWSRKWSAIFFVLAPEKFRDLAHAVWAAHSIQPSLNYFCLLFDVAFEVEFASLVCCHLPQKAELLPQTYTT